jgi:TonB-dependent receptor
LRSALVAGVAMMAVAPAAAQTLSFNLPVQDLSSALQAFALQTNRELLYSPQLVANRRSGTVNGNFTAPVALRRLLQGTDLEFRQPAPNVFVLQRNRPTANTASVSTLTSAAPASAPTLPVSSAAESGAPGAVSGVVIDAATNSPLPGAVLRIEGTGLSAVADERGAYRFPAVPPGTYNVVLEYLGDASRSEQVTLGSGEQVSLNFGRGGDENEIVVYGYSSAIQSALNQQRAALNSATIVSEDLLGGFPAETVSEALRRVPGVAFTRAGDTGEGSGIAVRGFGSEAINIQMNGIDLQGTSFERTIDLSGYLAENISTITIHKTLLPSHQATGSGGFVQIETRSGLDYGDFHFSANMEGERALEGGFGNEWQAGATIGGRLAPNLGVVATVSYRDTNRRNFDVSTVANTPAVFPAGFTGVSTVPASQQFPFDPEFSSRLITGASYSQRSRDETTLAASLNVAWDIGDHTRLRFDLQRNEREASTYSARTVVSFLPLTNIDMPVAELGGEVRRRIVLSSFRPNLALASTDLSLATDTVSVRGDTNIDRWQFRYKAGYSRARSRSDNTALNLLGNTLTNIRDLIDPSTIVIQPDDDAARTLRVVDGGFVLLPNGVPVPSLTQAGINALLDPAGYRLASASRSRTNSPTQAWIIEGSARYTAGSWLDYLEVGFKYDRSRRSALDGTFATTAIGALRSTDTYTPISGRDTFLSTIDSALLLTDSFGLIGVDFAIPSVNANGNRAMFGALDRLLVDDPSTPFNEARFTLRDVTDADPVTNPSALQPASTMEERLAGYVEAHVEFGDFDIVGGARFERARRTGTALAVPVITLPSNITEPRSTFIALGLVDFLDTSSTDTTITPSVLVNYRPSRHIVARLGYNRSTVNPSIQLIRRSPTYIVNLRTNRVGIQEGNPDLRPTVTDNFDLDLAYYFRNTPGLVRAGFFYKKTTNNFSNILIADRPGDVRDRILTYFQPLVATRPELFAFNDQTEFFVSRPENGEGGTIWGVELELIRRFDFLPGFLGGFGVIGNLTYTKGDFPTLVSGRTDAGVLTNFSLDRPLEEQAALVYNAALTYAGGGFEGRLIYTHQSVTVNSYEVHDINTVTPSYATLDLRLSYNFRGPGGGLFTLFLEGDDLLRDADDPDIRSAIANTPGRDEAQYFFPNVFQFNGGRTFTAGVRARF